MLVRVSNWIKVSVKFPDGQEITVAPNIALSLSSDQTRTEIVVSELIVSRRVMYYRWESESFADIKASVADMIAKIDTFVTPFVGSQSGEDEFYASLLNLLKVRCKDLLHDMDEAEDAERSYASDPADSGFGLPARDELPRLLYEFRAKSYPILDALIAMLPEDNSIRLEAVERLDRGKRLLEKSSYVPPSLPGLAADWDLD
jgi:hypothetical protein